MAGSLGLREAVKNAQMVLIEPIMEVEVSTPEEFMGDVIGDLGSRRAQIQGTTNTIFAGISLLIIFVNNVAISSPT